MNCDGTKTCKGTKMGGHWGECPGAVTGFSEPQLNKAWENIGKHHRGPLRAAAGHMSNCPDGPIDDCRTCNPETVQVGFSTKYAVVVPQCDLCGFTPAAMQIEDSIPDPTNVTEEPSITRYCLACYDARSKLFTFVKQVLHHGGPGHEGFMVEMEKVVGDIVSMSRKVFLSYEDK